MFNKKTIYIHTFIYLFVSYQAEDTGGKTNGTMDEQLKTEAKATEELVTKAIEQAKKSVIEVIDISESFSNGEGNQILFIL